MKVKNVFLIKACLFGVALVVLVSCSREALQPESSGQAVQGAGNCPSRIEFVAGKSLREYLVAYRLLSAEDRLCMWKDKLEHSKQFFDEQGEVDFINHASEILTLQIIESGNPAGFEENFVADAKEFFSFPDVARIFMVLHDYDHPPLPMTPNQTGSGSSNDCECYYSIYCGINGVCASGRCRTTQMGCGIFGGANCRGLCEL